MANDQAEDELGEIEEIVVTGSRIASGINAYAQPVLTIDPQEIQTSGFNNLVDFLQDVPALQGSVTPDETTGATLGAAGLNTLNLRQLGVSRTLVLINGRRQVASQPGTAAVDINTIPTIMIERPEIITGGASSIYGADAVSGVVNFVLKEDFNGIELDGTWAINEDGNNQSLRTSFLGGGTFGDNRGHATIAVEYRQAEELFDDEIDHFARGASLIRVDQDQATIDTDGDGDPDFAPSDGNPNFFLIERDARLGIITSGGVLDTFGNGQFEFGPGGIATPVDPGAPIEFFDPNLEAQNNTRAGGTGAPVGRRPLVGSRIPENETIVTRGNFDYDVTEFATVFMDFAYMYSKSNFSFQPSFFSGSPNFIGIANDDRTLPSIDEQQFNVGLFTGTDNAFLDPTAAEAIETGLGVGSVQRFMTEFNRAQSQTIQTFQLNTGVEGDFQMPFLGKNWNYDVAMGFGRSTLNNRQLNNRINPRFFASIDAIEITQDDLQAIADAGNSSDFAVGDVVCRAQFLQAAGLPVNIPGIGAISQNTIDECVPSNIFGPGSLDDEAVAYMTTDLNDAAEIEQLVVTGNLVGELFDPFGAGDAALAVGIEYRREDSAFTPSQLPVINNTFGNAIQPTVGRFDVMEGYAEVNVPLLKDQFLAETLSITGSVRQSHYDTIGSTTTWAAQGIWSPVSDVILRGGRALAIRAPNIGELFQAPSQTFAQIDDPCSADNLDENPEVAANRRRNCAALGIPDDYLDPNPNASNPGVNSGNINLQEERSRSYWAGITVTPRWLPNFTLTADFYDIVIEDAIQAVPIQRVVDDCVDGSAPSATLCQQFTRDPLTFEIIDFIQSDINTGFLNNRGVDFQATYFQDVANIVSLVRETDQDWGQLRGSIRGTRFLRFNDQSDPNDPETFDTDLGQLGFPDTRFNLDVSWHWRNFSLGWEMDWQSSQSRFDRFARESQEDDDKSPFADSGSFAQHDFNVSYTFHENISFRAGVVNVFDNDPRPWAQNNVFDIFGRRFFVGVNTRF
ncbi:TonB-dependent receptor domain-containing protein [Rhodothalassium salexigens]|nr:TonB-dependent receptor [Rhodothalassium salexigens]MBK1639912.1 hypothetical protein [Rhodothalassium salexigens DSM 2132]